MSDRQNPGAAVEVAKEQLKEEVVEEVITLSTGVRAIFIPVAASLIQQVQAKIKDPDVPMETVEGKGDRKYPNPGNPEYIRKVEEADSERALAAVDAMIMFGVELVDPIPDNGWDTKLKYLEKRGLLDLSEFDLQDEMDREFLFKRLIAVASADLIKISIKAGVNAEEVAAAAASFPGNEGGESD